MEVTMELSLATLQEQVLQDLSEDVQDLLEDECLVEAYLTAYRDIMENQSFRY